MKIIEKLKTLREVSAAKRVAAFISDGVEPNLRDLLELIVSKKKQVYLPRSRSKTEQPEYEMVEVSDFDSELCDGPYGIYEPMPALNSISSINYENLTWLVPGVAFDWRGRRLGRGKGVYDRLLAKSHGTRIGVFYACQNVDFVPTDDLDQVLDIIVTENEIRRITQKRSEM